MRTLLRRACIATMLIVAFAAGTAPLPAQTAKLPKLPTVMGPTNSGRDFWFSFPTNYEDPAATAQYIRLYIASGVRTKVNVWVGGIIRKTIFTNPNNFVTVDLTKYDAQVVNRQNNTPIPPDQIYANKAVHVEAEAPIILYGMNRTSYTSDGMLILPVNGLGKEYVVAAARDAVTGIADYKLPSQYLIAAPYDGTTVTIMTADNTPSHKAGESFTVTLNQGDVFSSMSYEIGGDLSGSTILANKPVAVMAGENCTFLPDGRYRACDHVEEMLLPVSTWGKIYHSMPYATRLKGDMFRIFAGEDNTTVSVNGTPVGIIQRKGGPEGIGWITYLPDPNIRPPVPIEFTADKPISVAQYNNSQQYDGIQTDPFYCVLTPVEQYQNALIFTTPTDDYPSNFVTIVSDSAGFYQLEIADAGTKNWKKFSNIAFAGGGVLKKYPTIINGQRYVGITFTIAPGAYQMRGPGPFAGYIYSYSSYDSYGYPLAAALADLTKKDTVEPAIEKKQACDGTVEATTTDFPDEDAIRANLSTIELDPASYNYLLERGTLIPGTTRTTTYKLTVIDRTKDAMAIVVVADQAGNATLDTVYYNAFDVTITPSPIDFGQWLVGSVTTTQVSIKNNATRPVDVKRALLKVGTQNFRLVTPTGNFTLGPAGSPTGEIIAEIEFNVAAIGHFEDSLGLEDPCGIRYMALVTGEGIMPQIEVTDIPFGTQVVGTPVTKTFEIINPSPNANLTVTGVRSGPTLPEFVVSGGTMPTFPLVLRPGERRQVSVTFTPGAVQAYKDSIVFSSNAPQFDSVAVLTGQGIQPQLTATSYDWKRRRVGTGPYQDTVWLNNLGTAVIRVTGFTKSGHTTDFDVLNPTDIIGKDIPPNGVVPVLVQFTPTAIGPRQMVIDYQSASPNPVTSTLDGIGVVPSLATMDYNFGRMKVGDPEVGPQKIIFYRTGDPRYRDSVTITGFQFTSDQFGGQFDYRKALDAPVVLTTGKDTVEFEGYYQARATGIRVASVKALTLDGVDTTSHWTGDAFTQNADISGTSGSITGLCLGDSGYIVGYIKSTGQVTLTIDSLRLNGGGGDFTVTSPDPNIPFTIAPGDSIPLRIKYVARRSGPQSVIVNVYNSSANSPLPLLFDGTGDRVTALAHVDLTGTKLPEGGGTRGEFGLDITTAVVLDAAFAPFSVKDYTVTLTYDKLLMPRMLSSADIVVMTPPNAPGTTATLRSVDTTAHTVVIDVSSPQPITTLGPLLSVKFGVMFDTRLNRVVNAQIQANNAPCVTVNTIGDTIEIEPICGLTNRLIEITKANYTLQQNLPNPSKLRAVIPYSVGLDGQTVIQLFNANGELMQTLVNEYLQPGKYELTLDLTRLPSGLYYYRMTSGVWTQSRQMTVKK